MGWLSREEMKLLNQIRKSTKAPEKISENESHWDGSIDNQERILEEHVSKRGWEF